MATVYIIYYSMYGHIKAMADAVAKGAEKAGVTVKLFKVPETLPEEVLVKMGAAGLAHSKDVPVVDRETFVEADGFIFGLATRYGMMNAQMKAFFDSTGGHWSKGSLVGKTAGTFYSTATQGGGQETTAMTAVTQFTHHGMIYVPAGYTFGKLQFDNSVAHGGGPWGPGTLTNGDGSRMPSEAELEFATHYGEMFAKTTLALKKGREAGAA